MSKIIETLESNKTYKNWALESSKLEISLPSDINRGEYVGFQWVLLVSGKNLTLMNIIAALDSYCLEAIILNNKGCLKHGLKWVAEIRKRDRIRIPNF